MEIVKPADYQEEPDSEDGAESTQWILQKLKPKHKQVCALLAQGMKNVDVAKIVEVTPEYITMLLRQPLIVQELKRLSGIAEVKMESLFPKAVDVMGEVLQAGSNGEKLKAARLVGEFTKRIGSGKGMQGEPTNREERLVQLSERLVGLLETKRGNTYEGSQVSDAEIISERTFSGSREAQEAYGSSAEGD